MTLKTLFVDDKDLARTQGVTRTIHPGQKHPDNPVLAAAMPWEEKLICGGTVRRESTGYRMWYQSYGRRVYLNLYATSADGIGWERPILGQYPDFEGNLENNIFLSRLAFRSAERGPFHRTEDHNPNVLYTPHQGEERAYTLFSYEYGRSSYAAYDGYFPAYSRDGITWIDGPEFPVIPGHADVGWFTYDQVDQVFRGVVKTYLNIRSFHRRSVLATQSPDGLAWDLPRPALIPDLEDEAWAAGIEGAHTQFYGMPIFRYESMLLGFLQVFQVTDTENPSHDGPVHVQLVCSRDGRTWQRVGDRQAILALGPPGSWDAGAVYSGNSLVSDHDQVRLYYSGTSGTHAARESRAAIGMVWWPQDRFVGLAAGRASGRIELSPQRAGTSLHLNADASRGELVVEFSGIEERTMLKGDALDHQIDLPPSLQGQPVEVCLHLSDAEVFSLWWDHGDQH